MLMVPIQHLTMPQTPQRSGMLQQNAADRVQLLLSVVRQKRRSCAYGAA
jgi:hypothetical protein